MGPFDCRWHGPAFEGDSRHLFAVGALMVGAVFAPGPGARCTRYRVWVTRNMNPVDGRAASVPAAKREVEARVREALELMMKVPA